MKPISRHLVNGSTLMGFGITVILMSLNLLTTNKFLGTWSLLSGVWFLLLGAYECLIAAFSKTFFEQETQTYTKPTNTKKKRKKP